MAVIPSIPALEMSVAEALHIWPSLTGVFVRRGMACPGCAMAEFMSLAEAAEVYGLEPQAFINELRAAA
jgi:hybrid cluster-associated redox disulfide protein